MQDLNDMVTFARVVQANGFSEAARRMGASKSRISKAIAKLERSLGARLLNRSTRGLSLTEAGAVFYEHCNRIIEEAEQAAQLVGQLHSEPRGVLRVTTSVAFGTLHVAPALPQFLARYPDVRVDMAITDRIVDVVEEGYDVAIRIVPEPPLNFVARELAPVRRVVCATHEYFARNGVPLRPEDLRRHNCLHYTHFSTQGEWHFTGVNGPLSVPVSGNLRINDDEALSQAVLGGLGVALLPTFIIGDQIQSGQLQAVLSDYLPLARRVYAVYLQSVHLPPKVKAFVDFLRARFGPQPYWDASQPTRHARRTSKPVNSRDKTGRKARVRA